MRSLSTKGPRSTGVSSGRAKGAAAESIEAYDRSISIEPTPIALMGRARGYVAAGRYDEAIRDAGIVTRTPLEDINAFTLFQGYETLGLAYDKAGNAAAAESTFREGRRVLPIYSATLTKNSRSCSICRAENRRP